MLDDGSCVFPGCTDDSACNFDPLAGCDDGTCDFSEPNLDLTTHPWSIHSTPNDECSSWSSSFTIQLEPDGTAWYVFLYDQHPLFGQPQPYGVWSMCGDEFYLYGTAEPFSFAWNGSTIPMNPNNNVWIGTFSVGTVESVADQWPDTEFAHIAGTASNAEFDDNWCFEMLWWIEGCTDDAACNYEPFAVLDDGSCVFPGCTDDSACNFDPFAGCDDGTCDFSEPSVDITPYPWFAYTTSDDQCTNWISSNELQFEPDGTAWYVFNNPEHPLFGQPQPYGIWSMCGDQFYLYGTGEPFSFEWNGYTFPMNPNNNVWTGTFTYGPTASQIGIWSDGDVAHIAGTASNAETEDNWCFELLWRVEDCMDPVAYNYNVYALLESGCCVYELTNVPGCTDANALNFMELATVEDGSCIHDPMNMGCTDLLACNFNPNALVDDGSCDLLSCTPSCSNTWGFDTDTLVGGAFVEYPVFVQNGGQLDSIIAHVELNAIGNESLWRFMVSLCDPQGQCVQLGDFDVNNAVTTVTPWNEMPYAYADTMGTFMADVSEAGLQGEGEWTLRVWHGVPWNNTLTDYTGSVQLIGLCGDAAAHVVGCTDHLSVNYSAEAELDNGVCMGALEDCMDELALNFNPDATLASDNCVYTESDYFGCSYPSACNYAPLTVEDDGSCTWPEEGRDCNGQCLHDADEDNICDCQGDNSVMGCMDSMAMNWNPNATIEGPCEYPLIDGCMDSLACNYVAWAEISEFSLCIYPSLPYLDCEGLCLNDDDDDGVCNELEIEGCSDPFALNFNYYATDEGYCEYPSFEGCMDTLACNYVAWADIDTHGLCVYPSLPYLDCEGNCVNDDDDDGVCNELEIEGCSDPFALNFNYYATDEGYCEYPSYEGCMDTLACNYVAWADIDTYGLCVYPSLPYLDCEGNCLNDDDDDGVCNELEIEGCSDPIALNFNFYATDEGDCAYPFLPGCMDPNACNYFPDAEVDDGTCTYPANGWTDCSGQCVGDADGDGICDEEEWAGCTSSDAVNYQPLATDDDGSCIYNETTGCTYSSALNFNPDAQLDDGSCAFDAVSNPCPADVDLDGTVAIADLLIILAAFGEACD